MMFIILLRRARQKLAERKYRRNCEVEIGSNSKVNFRALGLTTPARLTIGTDTIFEGKIAAERPQATIRVGSNTFVGNSRLVSAESIEIGDNVLISWGCTISDHDSHSLLAFERKPDLAHWMNGEKDWTHVKVAGVKIDDDVWIGFNAVVLKGVTVGRGAVVAAGSIVTKDVPPYTLVAGNPARIIRKLEND